MKQTYAQIKGGNKLHLAFQVNDLLSQPFCGIKTNGYRMAIGVPLGNACKNCLRVTQGRRKIVAEELFNGILGEM